MNDPSDTFPARLPARAALVVMVYASPLAGLRVVSHGDTAELAKTILSVPQGIQVYPVETVAYAFSDMRKLLVSVDSFGPSGFTSPDMRSCSIGFLSYGSMPADRTSPRAGFFVNVCNHVHATSETGCLEGITCGCESFECVGASCLASCYGFGDSIGNSFSRPRLAETSGCNLGTMLRKLAVTFPWHVRTIHPLFHRSA